MNDTSRRRAKRLAWLVFGLLIIVTLAIGLAVKFVAERRATTFSKLQAKLIAIRAAGYPTTARELEKLYPPLPDEKNSAFLYLKAFSKLASSPADTKKWPILGTNQETFRSVPITPETRRDIGVYLDQNEVALALLHQGGTLEKGYYANGLTNGFANLLDAPIVKIRICTQLLDLSALMHAEAGRRDQAAAAIADSIGLARSLEGSPFVVGHLIRLACLRLSAATLETCLNKTRFSENQLQFLSTAFRNAERLDGMHRALVSEYCHGIWSCEDLMQNLAQSKSTSLWENVENVWGRTIFFPDGDFLFYLDVMEKYLHASQLAFPERLKAAKNIRRDAEERTSALKASSFLLMYKGNTIFYLDAECQAALLSAETAIAVERYRLQHQNQLPRQLRDLVPAYLNAMPIDPFDGQPLRYKQSSKGYVIYSVGPDGVDDGGKERNREVKSENGSKEIERYDLTCTVE